MQHDAEQRDALQHSSERPDALQVDAAVDLSHTQNIGLLVSNEHAA